MLRWNVVGLGGELLHKLAVEAHSDGCRMGLWQETVVEALPATTAIAIAVKGNTGNYYQVKQEGR